LAAAAVTSAAACGDDKVAAQQAVVWFGLGTSSSGASCSTLKNYQFPEGARSTITGGDGVGGRLKDGSDNLVECDVRLASGSTTNYNVSVRFSGGDVGNFVATGVVPAPPSRDTTSTGKLDLAFNTAQFALDQDGCTVDIKTLVPGAIWIRNLHCDNLRDPSSPGIACDGLGGVIFENCSH
jgi:hypothetical protein